MDKQSKSSCDLKIIPGVGDNMRLHLNKIGIHTVGDLVGKNPKEMYMQDCIVNGCNVDRCVLYVYRLAVYFAENDVHQSEKLKWWYWKDKEYIPSENNADQNK